VVTSDVPRPAAFHNRVTRDLGVEIPIVQAPMGWIARSQLASALSATGAFGIIETSSGELDAVKDEIRKMRDLTDKPFSVNIAQAFVRDPAIAEFVIEQGVKFVTTSAGSPTKYTSILNVDVPIIAAGGITDGPTTAAAFALGAEGVQMGTRMVSAAESPVHQNWKQAITNVAETDTLFLNQRHSPGLRALRTDETETLVDATHNVFGDFGNALDLYFGGDMNAAIALSGQVAGRIKSIESVADTVADTVRGFARNCLAVPGLTKKRQRQSGGGAKSTKTGSPHRGAVVGVGPVDLGYTSIATWLTTTRRPGLGSSGGTRSRH
jgi:enoyl-[acyl-carrier protein] reductase II